MHVLDVPIFLAGAAGVAFKVKRDGGADDKKPNDSEREAETAPPPIPANRPVRLDHRVAFPYMYLSSPSLNYIQPVLAKAKTLRTELRYMYDVGATILLLSLQGASMEETANPTSKQDEI